MIRYQVLLIKTLINVNSCSLFGSSVGCVFIKTLRKGGQAPKLFFLVPVCFIPQYAAQVNLPFCKLFLQFHRLDDGLSWLVVLKDSSPYLPM